MRGTSLALLTLLAAPTAIAAADLGVTAAWGGWSRPGRTTWLELRLLSPVPGTAEVRISAGPETTLADVELRAGTPAALGVPARVRGEAIVTLRLPGGEATSQPVPVDLAEQPLVAWVAAAEPPARKDAPGLHVVALDPAAMPPAAAAYDAVDAVIADGAAVSALSQAQLAGLLGYLAGCGPAVFVALPPTAGRVVRDAAGCGGDRLRFIGQSDEALDSLAGLRGVAHGGEPTAATSARMMSHAPGSWRTATVLIAAYLCVLCWLILFDRRPSRVAGAILGGTAAAGLFIALAGRETSLTVWSEMRAGEHFARYVARETLASTAVGNATLDLPAFLDEPAPCDAATPAEWRWDGALGRYRSVRVRTALFDAGSICFRGSFPVLRPARLEPGTADRMRLTNPGESGWPAARLALAGEIHPVPPLGPGEFTDLVRGDGAAATAAVERIAVERTGLAQAGLLLPLAVPTDADGIDTWHAWLLVRIPQAAAEAT